MKGVLPGVGSSLLASCSNSLPLADDTRQSDPEVDSERGKTQQAGGVVLLITLCDITEGHRSRTLNVLTSGTSKRNY